MLFTDTLAAEEAAVAMIAAEASAQPHLVTETAPGLEEPAQEAPGLATAVRADEDPVLEPPGLETPAPEAPGLEASDVPIVAPGLAAPGMDAPRRASVDVPARATAEPKATAPVSGVVRRRAAARRAAPRLEEAETGAPANEVPASHDEVIVIE